MIQILTMYSFIFWFSLVGFFFLSFGLLLIFGIVRKNVNMIIIANVMFFGGVAASIYTAYLAADKAYNKIAANFRSRTGEEIYMAILGKPKTDCVKITGRKDQLIPKVDYAIYLKFEWCKEECERVLQLNPYEVSKIGTKNIKDKEIFDLKDMGDSVYCYRYKRGDYANDQYIFLSEDSTKAYLVDIWE